MLKQVELLFADGSKSLSWVDESIAVQGTNLTFDTGPHAATGRILRVWQSTPYPWKDDISTVPRPYQRTCVGRPYQYFVCGNHGAITRPEGRMELMPGKFYCSACLAEMMEAFGNMDSSHRHGGNLLTVIA